MEIIIYSLIFIMGLLFGSFFSLATYRLPLGKNITHERSFCPKCDHKLGFLDMIPLFSYIFLKGKCRYCKEKISIRYFLLELFSGIIFLLFSLSLNLNFFVFDQTKLIYLVLGVSYIIALMLIAGIDKEKRTISKQVLIYGMVVLFSYILYLYVVEQANIYRYAIYLSLMCVLIITNIFLLKKKVKENYTIDVLLLSLYIALFSGQEVFIYTILLTLIIIMIESIIDSFKKKEDSKLEERVLPIGFYLCTINIVVYIIQNFIFYRS